MEKVKVADNKKPIYKKWWFWVIIVIVLICVAQGSNNINKKDETQKTDVNNTTTNTNNTTDDTSDKQATNVKDYIGQDARVSYNELVAEGYTVKFVFDRTNNGGFTDSGFQDFVINDSFQSEYYTDMPFVVTKQSNNNKNVTLNIDYGEAVESKNQQANREANLEKKLSIVGAMSACEAYGKSHYTKFKLHGVTGKIAESATDDSTWYLKYYVDADGYQNKNMECYVTGTTNAPQVSKFLIY